MQKRLRIKISSGGYSAATLDADSAAQIIYQLISKTAPAAAAREAADKARAWILGPRRADDIYDGGTFVMAMYIPDPSKLMKKRDAA